jgi:hypothetical protein
MRRYDAALADFKTAYHVLEPFDPYMTAVTLTDMGWVLFAQGEHRELFECIRALAMNERLTPYEHQGVLFLAGYALLPTQPQRSTLLLAAATATENQVDDEVEMSADEQRVFDEHLHTLRSTLGEALFEELWARGQAMSWKQAIVVIQEGLAEQASATQAAVGATAGPRAP